jgi:hypothetical protein
VVAVEVVAGEGSLADEAIGSASAPPASNAAPSIRLRRIVSLPILHLPLC